MPSSVTATEAARRFSDLLNRSQFDPDLYDPEVWAAAAAGAGTKYFVVTAKHHEGFCLWDSQLTDYKAPNTPAHRDLLRYGTPRGLLDPAALGSAGDAGVRRKSSARSTNPAAGAGRLRGTLLLRPPSRSVTPSELPSAALRRAICPPAGPLV